MNCDIDLYSKMTTTLKENIGLDYINIDAE